MMFKSFVTVLAVLCVTGVSAFTPIHPMRMATSTTSPQMMRNNEAEKTTTMTTTTTAAASFFAAAVFLMGSAMDVTPAFAMDGYVNPDLGGGTTQILAARSGGRAGGRSAGSRAPSSRSSSIPSRSSSTRIIERTTYVAPAPAIYGSPMYVAPYYNPLPGLGFSMGLNAINQVGNDMRDYRQESEIQSTRAQLEQSKMREAEMEARLRQLELMQQGQMSQQQQMLMMQQTPQAATAAAK